MDEARRLIHRPHRPGAPPPPPLPPPVTDPVLVALSGLKADLLVELNQMKEQLRMSDQTQLAAIQHVQDDITAMSSDISTMAQAIGALQSAVASAVAAGQTVPQDLVDGLNNLSTFADNAKANADSAAASAQQAAATTAPPSAPLPNPPAPTS